MKNINLNLMHKGVKMSKLGYHRTKIKKGTLGKISKVQEEIEEYKDAIKQKCEIMAIVELADIYGALEAVAKSHKLKNYTCRFCQPHFITALYQFFTIFRYKKSNQII